MQVAASYDRALARKYPEQTAIAIARDAQGKHNPITLGWVMNTSHDPPMMAISIGLTRWSLEAVRHAREFVLSLPSSGMVEDTLFFGTRSGRDLDKLAVRGTRTQPASDIDSVLLSEAVANFECRLESELLTGDHVIFAARVVAAHMHEDHSVRRLYTLGGERFGAVVPE